MDRPPSPEQPAEKIDWDVIKGFLSNKTPEKTSGYKLALIDVLEGYLKDHPEEEVVPASVFLEDENIGAVLKEKCPPDDNPAVYANELAKRLYTIFLNISHNLKKINHVIYTRNLSHENYSDCSYTIAILEKKTETRSVTEEELKRVVENLERYKWGRVAQLLLEGGGRVLNDTIRRDDDVKRINDNLPVTDRLIDRIRISLAGNLRSGPFGEDFNLISYKSAGKKGIELVKKVE